MNIVTGVRKKLLENLVDDSFDLFEIVSLVGSEMPSANLADQRAAAKVVVRELLEDDLISAWILPSIGAEETPLPRDQLHTIFASEPNWTPPVENGPRIRLLATSKGREVYYGSGPPP